MRGWKVVTAVSGREALKILKEGEDDFDCVLLDVRMPDLGADEVLFELQNIDYNSPIVLMSGYSKTQLDSYLNNNQVEMVLTKPFRSTDLANVIDSVVRAKEEQNSSS